MGQAMTSETLCISGNDGHRYWVGLQAKPSSRGWKKTVYKGVLLGCGPRQWEKVVAKSFSSITGTKESWSHEVKKADISKKLAVEFAESCPSEFKIRVVIPGLVQMDKVSKVNRWLEHRHGHRSLDKDEWISIEEHIPGRVYRFCPWQTDRDSEDDEVMASDHLQTFSHFTYKQTNGDMVACDFQGIIEDDLYIFTDSIIHSRHQSYGTYDAGEYGMTEFFKRHRCTRICKDWPKPTPLSPPPTFESGSRNTSAKHVRFDLTPFENVVFHSQRLKVKSKKKGTRNSDSRRRHASDHDERRKHNERDEARRQEERGWYALTEDEQEECRRFVELYPPLSAPEDNPPAYSEFDNASCGSRDIDCANFLMTSVSLDESSSRSSSSYNNFANENAGPCCGSSGGSNMRSCLKKNYSAERNDIMTTRDFNLPSNHGSHNKSGPEEKKSLTSKEESPPTNSSNIRPTFDLGVPVNKYKSTSTGACECHNGKPVHSGENIEEVEDENMEDCETPDSNSKHSELSGASAACHVHECDSQCSRSPPKSSLMDRRLSKEKGDNSKSNPPLTAMNELELNLPPLQPSAPRLSDSES